MGKDKEIHLDHSVAFDVIIDGERANRVTHGILFGKHGDTLVGYFGAGTRDLIYEAAYALSKFIVNNNLQKEFEEFVKAQKQ